MGLLFKVNGVSSSSDSYRLLSFAMLAFAGTFIACWVLAVALALVRTLSSRHPSLERRLPLFLTTDKVGILARRPSRKTIGESVIPGRLVSVNPLAAPSSLSSASSSTAVSVGAANVPLRSNPMLARTNAAGAGTGSSNGSGGGGGGGGGGDASATVATRSSSIYNKMRGRASGRSSQSGDSKASSSSSGSMSPDAAVVVVDRLHHVRRASRPPPPPVDNDVDVDVSSAAIVPGVVDASPADAVVSQAERRHESPLLPGDPSSVETHNTLARHQRAMLGQRPATVRSSLGSSDAHDA
jgi:hypothetical protein